MLTPEEQAFLQKNFRLRPLAAADARSMPAEYVLNAKHCDAFLRLVMPLTGAPDVAIAASLFAKRLAFLATGNVLYAMSVFDSGLTFSLSRSRLEYAHDNGLWTSSLPADTLVTCYLPGERDAWREEVVSALFRGFLSPLWQSLAGVSGLPIQILWENTAMRVFSLYQGRMDRLDETQNERRDADFNWLIGQASPSLFGLSWNPLQRFRRPLQLNAAGKPVRFRRTCCFYYKATDPVEYCLNCPLCRPK
ncbi:MAG: siderophore-iron reductase, Fe-S cluster protein [Pantoea sp. Morm]|jgi:ferric iron reductase protein FhuF|uniref:Siderophore-iron reductase, Fe-S cluster protein n=1 Tax=Candidatus Pantoea communis TaxID=2608354 RepID=A0ABX0S0I2_9GAMM|nr:MULTISPECIES: IucA/IucC family C-terminal-domain containing protein [Enterobacterales]KGT86179.1 siderophore-iron reductase, Fe-S cluster protein [Enterobacter cancerogenus]MBK4772044.1 siderophore-iron reductase, Fe-S cluster protein [Pantoea sp. Morm]MDF7629884.1 IucA/IucC family C-terminal-domain containing protein [Erwiniaceae bacterium L1_55_4]NIG22301.1 siderophore-iron reductase, Fe-S cluster protein [Pantoea communis]